MYSLLVILVIGSCRVNADGVQFSKIIPFEMGGSQFTFSLVELDIGMAEVEQLKCVARFLDGRISTQTNASIPRDGQSAICRLPEHVQGGGVDIQLVHRGISLNDALSEQNLFVDPIERSPLIVAENWYSNQLSLTWDPDYFAQFFAEGATFLMQLTVYVGVGFGGGFAASAIVQLVGQNTGATTISLTAANLQRLSEVRYPYYYVLRAVGTVSGVYVSSRVIAPTFGMDEASAQETCSNWLLTAETPAADEINPCPPCLCQVVLDANFMPREFPLQWVQLADGALNDHVLYQERVATPSGYTQTCSYNATTRFLASKSPAQAGFINFVSSHISPVNNFFADIWPYMVCCLQSNSQEHCDLFHEKRPISTGHDYPGVEDPTCGWGDPHMVTFESIKYDFMGYGEFWLIKGPNGSDFGLQGRMSPNAIGQQVSFFKAVAIQEGNTTVQIEIREGNLAVFLNGTQLRFVALPVSIQLGKILLDINTARIDVRCQSGFTVFVEIRNGVYIDVYASGAQYNKGKGFMGIFGNFDNNPNNDLTSRDGYVIPPSLENIKNLSLIHHRFGLTWLVNATESFFVYKDGTSWDDFNNIDFGPISAYADPATLPEEVRAICGESLFCLYEFVGTGSLERAAEVARQETAFDELREEIATVIPLCSTLDSPANGRVSVNGHMDGALATYTCNREYDIENGDTVRRCSASAELSQWTGVEPNCIWTCTICHEDTEFELTHDPSNGSRFFLCSYGMRFTLDCPKGECFNRNSGACSSTATCRLGC